MTLIERLDIYEKLMRLDKPIGILLLLWPTLWGLWLSSEGMPDPTVVAVFVFGVVLMRSAGCIVNDFADRNLDSHVERTRNRPLAARIIPSWEALLLAGTLMLLAFLLVLQLNHLTLELAVVALLLAVVYPFLKRFFWLPQAWLGIAFGFGIPMAFAAHQNAIAPVAWVLMIANMFWAIAYDTEYAMVDRDDDVKLGLKSSAILFGRFDVHGVILCHALFLLMMAAAGWQMHLGLFYFAALAVAAGLVCRQFLLIRERQRDRCFRAFLNNGLVGAVIYGGILLDFLLHLPLFSE